MSSSTTTAAPAQQQQQQQQQGNSSSASSAWEELRKEYPQLPANIPIPKRSVECNAMSYTDDSGVLRQIWMPKGTMKTACRYFEKEDWKALAKWPVYADQGYADEGEAEEEERKAWEWLTVVDDKEEENAEKEEK